MSAVTRRREEPCAVLGSAGAGSAAWPVGHLVVFCNVRLSVWGYLTYMVFFTP